MQALARSVVIMTLAGACLTVAATATAAADSDPSVKEKKEECLFFRTVYDWRALDDRNLVIWGPGSKELPYHVQLFYPLSALRYEHTIAFIDADRDGRLCGYGRDSISERPSNAGAEKSSITSIKQLVPETLAQLEEKYKMTISREKGKKKTPAEPEGEAAK